MGARRRSLDRPRNNFWNSLKGRRRIQGAKRKRGLDVHDGATHDPRLRFAPSICRGKSGAYCSTDPMPTYPAVRLGLKECPARSHRNSQTNRSRFATTNHCRASRQWRPSPARTGSAARRCRSLGERLGLRLAGGSASSLDCVALAPRACLEMRAPKGRRFAQRRAPPRLPKTPAAAALFHDPVFRPNGPTVLPRSRRAQPRDAVRRVPLLACPAVPRALQEYPARSHRSPISDRSRFSARQHCRARIMPGNPAPQAFPRKAMAIVPCIANVPYKKRITHPGRSNRPNGRAPRSAASRASCQRPGDLMERCR